MGKIQLDHTGSGSGITLSSDGTSLLLDGTAIGGGIPTTGGTFTGDVTFDGATAGRDILFDRSENKLNFAHDTKLTIGNNDELEIQKHTTGGVSLTATGYMALKSDSDIDFKVSNQDRITLRTSSFGGQVELYNAGSKKFETSSTGATVYGTLVATTFSGSGANLTNLPASDLVNDTSPQLGGNLDVQAREINTSTTNGNIVFNPNGTGVVEVKGAGGNDGTLQLNCSANSHGVKIKSPPHSAGASYTLTLPNDDGDASEFLQTNGSGVLTWAAAGASLYSANESSPSAQPSATGANAIAIGDSASATGQDSVAIGDGATAVNNKDFALGISRASGGNATSIQIENNTSSYGASDYLAVAIGKRAKASQGSAVAIGDFVTATGGYAVAIGQASEAVGYNSMALGKGALPNENGKLAYASGWHANFGDAQGGQFILRGATTDATARALTTDGSGIQNYNQVIAKSDTCITFDGTIVAMQNGAQAYASWKIEGLLVNDGGTTTLANSAITVIQNSSNWGLALSADNTNNALAVTCTGEANHNIRWVANIRTSEVTYA